MGRSPCATALSLAIALRIEGGSIDGGGTVRNSTFSGNTASIGGAIHGSGLVENSIFFGNSADIGGGIVNVGTVTVSNSTFHGNAASQSGGGIHLEFGVSTVVNTTFSGNRAGDGGGIYSYGSVLAVSNSTFSGNSATVGGGINNNGTLTVSNSTFSGNGAVDGGGVYNQQGAVVLKNTIVADSPSGNNCSGAITDGGGNFSYPDTTCPGINADPLLGPLQNNGGPTRTMALGEGSAALDAGIDLTCISAPVNSLDQRGVMRPQGTHCDSGSVEQAQEPVVTLVEVCDEAHLRAALAAGGMVTFACSGVITLADEIALAANVTIDGSGQDVTISGNHAVRVFRVDPGWTLNLRELAIVDGAAALGGAITVNMGAVTVSHCTFSGHNGGAIVNDGGTLTVSQSTFSANDGRSISNNGSEARLTVSDSLFSDNNGGGIYNGGAGYGGTAIVTNSTFVGNTTAGPGGGIHNDWASFLTVTDSTFSSNSAGEGGGIFSYGNANGGQLYLFGQQRRLRRRHLHHGQLADRDRQRLQRQHRPVRRRHQWPEQRNHRAQLHIHRQSRRCRRRH